MTCRYHNKCNNEGSICHNCIWQYETIGFFLPDGGGDYYQDILFGDKNEQGKYKVVGSGDKRLLSR